MQNAFGGTVTWAQAAAYIIGELAGGLVGALMAAAEATAHGHAALLPDGSFDDEADPVGSAADQARGRDPRAGPGPQRAPPALAG